VERNQTESGTQLQRAPSIGMGDVRGSRSVPFRSAAVVLVQSRLIDDRRIMTRHDHSGRAIWFPVAPLARDELPLQMAGD
jgi:hypothetical protein